MAAVRVAMWGVVLLGLVLFVLGLLGVAAPPPETGPDPSGVGRTSPLVVIGPFLVVLGGLGALAVRAVRRAVDENER